jgi:ubiquinone/menaquinone biosynthesis C-methylase UbiE
MTPDPKRDFFNAQAAAWDSNPEPPEDPGKRVLFVARSIPPGARRVLDVGCGTGILLDAMECRDGHGRTVVELDLAERMLAENRRKCGGRAWVAHVCASVAALPFAPERFDAVLCFNALPHFDSLEAALRSMLACLRPGGWLTVGHLMSSALLNEFHASLEGAVRGDHLPEPEALARTLSALNAEVLCCEEDPGWYFVQARKPAR